MILSSSSHVAIVGAGFSGSLLAINLLRFEGPRVTLIERDAALLGRGVAYGTAGPDLILNVRAAGMSAFPDDDAHFARWLARATGDEGAVFAERRTYGRYLAELLDEARRRAPERLTVLAGTACDVVLEGERPAVRLADGGRIEADAVVLAIGNLPPHPPPGLAVERLAPGLYQPDPWRPEPSRGLTPDGTVVLLGTGLTAVDAALSLDACGWRGRILALSRRGLLPRAHQDGQPKPAGLTEVPRLPLSALVRRTRRRAAEIGWRSAVDELRPVTQRLWARADTAARARFLRHLRPYWDVHRHRLAPAVAARLDRMAAEGRFTAAAGAILDATSEGGEAVLRWRRRRTDEIVATRAERIINCTGPQGDLTRTTDPLLAALAARGAIRADALRLGIDTDARGRAIAADGRAHPRLFCVGPLTRGGLWEVVAVPDLRRQAWSLARIMANAHWTAEGL